MLQFLENDLYTLRQPVRIFPTFIQKMKKTISPQDLQELENLLMPLENRMQKIIRHYVLASHALASIEPRLDLGADDLWNTSYDVSTVLDLLEYFAGIIEKYEGLPNFALD